MIAIVEVYNSMLELYKFFLTYMVHLDVENGRPMGDLVEKLISNPDKYVHLVVECCQFHQVINLSRENDGERIDFWVKWLQFYL